MENGKSTVLKHINLYLIFFVLMVGLGGFLGSRSGLGHCGYR